VDVRDACSGHAAAANTIHQAAFGCGVHQVQGPIRRLTFPKITL
jgi:hypothetical protein